MTEHIESLKEVLSEPGKAWSLLWPFQGFVPPTRVLGLTGCPPDPLQPWALLPADRVHDPQVLTVIVVVVVQSLSCV